MSRHIRNDYRSARQGSTVIEMTVSLIVLTVLIGVMTQALLTISHQRRAIQRRQLALQDAANLMEEIMVLPWDDAEKERIRNFQLSDQTNDALPSATLEFDIVDEAAQPRAKRVTITISWLNRAGQIAKPVKLTAWKYDLWDAEE